MRRAGKLLAVFLFPVFLTALPASAQAPASTAAPSAAAGAASGPDVRTYTLPPKKLEKARALSRAWYTLAGVRVAWGILVLLTLLAWRVPARYRDWAERCGAPVARPWLRGIVEAAVFVPLLLLTLRALRLPFSIWGHWLSRTYELSVQGWGSWAWDWTKGAALNAAVGAAVVGILYAVIRWSPRRWWMWCWAATMPIVVVGVFLAPLVVDPLFYEYRPLEQAQPALVAEIEKVVRRGELEIPRERMFEMVASEKLRVANAYVTGIGASKRVVVWDTTLQMLTVEQTLAVFGHEMGHYVLNHIPKGIALAAALLFAFFWFASRAVPWALTRWGPRWQIRFVGDWASLPVLLLLLNLAQFVAAPGINAYSRAIEHDADVYALEVTRGIVPDAGLADAQAQQVMAEAALEDPDPPCWAVWWLYTHPPSRERIEFARSYDPWSQGRPPKFVK